jgi:hypothetical protein
MTLSENEVLGRKKIILNVNMLFCQKIILCFPDINYFVYIPLYILKLASLSYNKIGEF